MKLFIFLCLSQALLCTLVCGHHGGPHDDDDHDHHDHQQNEAQSFNQILAAENYKILYKFYYHLAATNPNENFFYAPISIFTTFYLLSLGAKSKTLRQIHEGFGFDTSTISEQTIRKGYQKFLNIINQPKGNLQLDSANALFIDNKLNLLEKFLEDAKKFYQSEAISIDFEKVPEAVEQINSYVEKKTNGKIKDLLDNLDPQSALVIVNTLFFKGTWEHAFNVNHTTEEDFHVDENTVVKVQMMHRQGVYSMGYIPEAECTVVEVPYKGNTTAIFILPKEGKTLQDIEKVFQNPSQDALSNAMSNAMKPSEIILSLPKFSMSSTLDLVKELQHLGVTEVFSDQADLSGITGDSRLKVSKAVHKVMVTMDEEGTEAAASTTIGKTNDSIPPSMKLSRPFIFSIYNYDIPTEILGGRIVDPTK